MRYETITTKLPHDLAEKFRKFARDNDLTVSMALKLLILEKLKQPNPKLMPYWNLLKELYQRIDLNLVLTAKILECSSGIKKNERELISSLLDQDREMLEEYTEFLKKMLKV